MEMLAIKLGNMLELLNKLPNFSTRKLSSSGKLFLIKTNITHSFTVAGPNQCGPLPNGRVKSSAVCSVASGVAIDACIRAHESHRSVESTRRSCGEWCVWQRGRAVVANC